MGKGHYSEGGERTFLYSLPLEYAIKDMSIIFDTGSIEPIHYYSFPVYTNPIYALYKINPQVFSAFIISSLLIHTNYNHELKVIDQNKFENISFWQMHI